MALGLPLPKQIFGHPWMLFGKDKMSKSKGNVIYADELADQFGVDAVRYYMLSEMPFAQDGAITYETVIARYNSDLANTLGNLVNRTVTMVQKYFDGNLSHPDALPDIAEAQALQQASTELIRAAGTAYDKFDAQMQNLRVADALEAVLELARRANKYIDETAPWALARDEDKRGWLLSVLYDLLESIRFIGVLLLPFLPETSEKIFEQINCPAECRTLESLSGFGSGVSRTEKVGQPAVLFARLDEKAKLEELLAFAETQKKAALPAAPAAQAVEGVASVEEITIDDFRKVNLRAAKILSCDKVEKSDKLYRLMLNDGSGRERQVVSGIAAWYRPEELVGKTVVVIANLKPAKLRGVESNGMLLAADAPGADGKDRACVVFLDDSVPAGAKIR